VAQRGYAAIGSDYVGQVGNCGRLSIGLPKLSRNQQQADFQSAAGCHPAPQIKVCNWLNKIVAARKETKI